MRYLFCIFLFLTGLAYGAETAKGMFDTQTDAQTACLTYSNANIITSDRKCVLWSGSSAESMVGVSGQVTVRVGYRKCDGYSGSECAWFLVVAACPSGEEFWNHRCVPKCDEGETRDESGQCTGPCKSGEEGTGSWFEGIASSPSWKPSGTTLPTGVMCDGECQIAYTDGDVEDCVFTKGQPFPKGLWCYFKGTKNGKTCSYGDQSLGNGGIAPNDDSAVCVNGVCTASPGSSATTQNTDNTSNGGSAGGNKTCANGATNYPTCTAPTGTSNSGTPVGTGTVVTGTVSLDEGGTATGVDRGAGGADLEAQTKERKDAFSDQTKVGELPWKFTFSLPSNSCHTLKFGVFGREHSFDVCPWLSMVREGLGYLIYFLTTLYIWRSLTGAVGASGAK